MSAVLSAEGKKSSKLQSHLYLKYAKHAGKNVVFANTIRSVKTVISNLREILSLGKIYPLIEEFPQSIVFRLFRFLLAKIGKPTRSKSLLPNKKTKDLLFHFGLKIEK